MPTATITSKVYQGTITSTTPQNTISGAIVTVPASGSPDPIIAKFSDSWGYLADDYDQVSYGGAVYTCTVNHPAGAWNAAHFALSNQPDLSGKENVGVAATLDAAHLANFTHGNIAHSNRADLDAVSNTNTGDQDLSGLEPAIPDGTTDQFLNGAKSWANFAATVRSTDLEGLVTTESGVIIPGDTTLEAFGKLQNSVTAAESFWVKHIDGYLYPKTATDAVAIGGVAAANTMQTIRGVNSLSSDYCQQNFSETEELLFAVRNDGLVSIGALGGYLVQSGSQDRLVCGCRFFDFTAEEVSSAGNFISNKASLGLQSNDQTTAYQKSGITIARNMNFVIDFRPHIYDTPLQHIYMMGDTAPANNTNYLNGGDVSFVAGDGAANSSGDAHGGRVFFDGGQGYGTGVDGDILLQTNQSGYVGIGTTLPITNTDFVGGNARSIKTETDTYTITVNDYTVIADISTDKTFKLPPVADSYNSTDDTGLVLHIKNKTGSTGNIILDGNNSETIEGQTTQTIIPSKGIKIQANSTEWIILSSS